VTNIHTAEIAVQHPT